MRSHLNHPACAARGLHHSEAIRNGMGQRLLDVNVFAGFHRIDGHLRVPVVRRGDDHEVE